LTNRHIEVIFYAKNIKNKKGHYNIMEATIKLNGKDYRIEEGKTIRALIKELGIEKKNFVVEVNRKIVRRKDFDNFSLKDGDKVEIIHFVGGG
jgi:thiamine biosynthesis protein ThiS